ncbi:rho guanyl nucleotide exchange factor [Aspergillus heteromorphus CBS 117.55]|uniref:Rho guanyl nucleotide exchange factor n=1 Tax=Aspergillus heteromorphus CBS 117.55 TaxID=1448321 RepID=A0A317WST7_9EURO|nr:rho guanyl nucleotide exchange factor [Aspergillus heteromorphus CBS 117.55]PWY88352.1 rho guanyl nucleotide exchange factor [Aspergillus heteromorphus CBS 117.55]
MEESKDIAETPLLVLEKTESEENPTRTHAVPTPVEPVAAFKRWVSSFRPKKNFPLLGPGRYVNGWPEQYLYDKMDYGSELAALHEVQEIDEKQWESLSGHSSHLGTVKTSTLSIASQSAMRSRGTTQSTANHSIRSDVRESLDSIRPTSSFSIDEEAQHRAIKRRRVLRELITTECDYVFGLKALADALFIFSVRPEIYCNVQQIRDTHEDFLAQIRKLTPISNLAGAEFDSLMPQGFHKRLSAIDFGFKAFQNRSLRSRNFRASVESRLKALAAEAKEALQVAREVGNLAKSFAAYKVFCKNYGLLTVDVTLLRQSIPNWRIFDQGIEALSKSVASMERQTQEENKAMSLNDLLIKPVQRLCKYPLLLEELLKWTHIQDDPSAHDGIRQVLETVRAVVCEVNQVTDNPINKALVDKTLVLQTMLDFSASNVIYDIYRQLGPLTLCGVLHVTYQTPKSIENGYMVCIMFGYHLLIAKINDDYRKLLPVACLYVSDMKIDSPRNGEGEYIWRGLCILLKSAPGLQCYECLFSWKTVFQYHDKYYELVLSASSACEEKKWKTEILKSAAASTNMQKTVSAKLKAYSFLTLELIPLTGVAGLTPCLPRRPSMQALATSRAQVDSQNIVIKNTHCPHRYRISGPVGGEIERPKTPISCSAFILTAHRQDRIRLERAISSVYTRDVLPYPGMTLAAGDIIKRHLSLRPGLYRRSSSVSLRTNGTSSVASTGATRVGVNKLTKNNEKQARNVSKTKPASPGQEKGPDLPRHGKVTTIRRSKTWKGKGGHKPTMEVDTTPISKGSKGHESPEYCTMKASTIRRMFNSMSSRRPKRHGRMGLGSGAS